MIEGKGSSRRERKALRLQAQGHYFPFYWLIRFFATGYILFREKNRMRTVAGASPSDTGETALVLAAVLPGRCFPQATISPTKPNAAPSSPASFDFFPCNGSAHKKKTE